MGLVMEAQYHKSLHRPLHVDIKDKIMVQALARTGEDALEASLAELPFVRQVGRANGVPLLGANGQYSEARDGREVMYRFMKVDSTAFRMLGFEVVKDYHAPLTGGVWFGETAYAATGLTDDDLSIDLLSKRTGGVCDHVAGIISDFPIDNSNMGAQDLVIVTIAPRDDLEGSFLLDVTEITPEVRKAVQETVDRWKQTTQVYYSSVGFLEDQVREGLRPARNNMRLLEIFMLLAVLISLLGLVAMSTYYADERATSIAVRKVFGGTVDSELWRGVWDYMVMVVIACAIGIPVAIWAAGRYLERFTVRLERYGWIFVVAVMLSVTFAFVSVLWQTLKAAKTNPAVELKKE